MEFHNIGYDVISKAILPQFLLSVEKDELHISAGLQDRVIQVYGGVVYMDFSKELMETQGHGDYRYINSGFVPSLFIAYTKCPSGESGHFHNPIHYRFDQGDKEVVNAMNTFASLAQQARDVLMERDYMTFGELMNRNINLRRELYGDHALGRKNLEMMRIARQNGSPVKFCGSGGAVVGMYGTQDQFELLRKDYHEKGFECIQVTVDAREM